MLELFRKEFESIVDGAASVNKRDMLLANLMSKMECHYKIGFNKKRFEKEIDKNVRDLYIEISNTRKL